VKGTKGIEYPEVNFWDKTVPKIDFINKEDFRRNNLLKQLRIGDSPLANSFGIVDAKEIKNRQQIVKFLMDNPEIVKILQQNFSCVQIPFDGQGFLDYYNPKKEHNPFWELVHNILGKIISNEAVPKELQKLVQFVNKTSDIMEKKERKMTGEVAEKLQKSAFFEGIAEFQISQGRIDEVVYKNCIGYKKYSFGLSSAFAMFIMPEWVNRKKWIWLKPILYIFGFMWNELRRVLFYSSALIKKIPSPIYNALYEFVSNLVEVAKNDKIKIEIYFRYETALSVRVVKLETIWTEDKDDFDETYYKNDFLGYNLFRRIWIDVNQWLTRVLVDKRVQQIRDLKLVGTLEEQLSVTVETVIIVENNKQNIDLEMQWYGVSELLNGPELEETFKEVLDYRDYILDRLRILGVVADLAQKFVDNAKLWDIPLHFPEILDNDQHLISFKSLHPVHLINNSNAGEKLLKASDLIPIQSLPAINGQIIGFTGQNKGGKSTTEETLVNALYLAQSGLPVFGSELSLNVKNKIGLVFLERGEGSTCELLLLKIKNILKELNGSKRNGTFLILDEVGTGTQEIDGLAFGKELLTKLSGFSVIFSTQILGLAKYAEDKLNAKCFQFNMDHQINSGIGRGGIEKLISQIGLDQYLN